MTDEAGGGMTERTRQGADRRPGWGFAAALLSAAAALFLGLAAYMRGLERRALEAPAIREQLTSQGRARPLAGVAEAIRQMKLVTVEVDSSVVAEACSEGLMTTQFPAASAAGSLLASSEIGEFQAVMMPTTP